MSPDHDPGRSFPQARVAQDPPPPFELEDYEDLVPGPGPWARAPLERPHGDRAALVPQPIAGFPAARGRGRVAHQAAGALGRGGWERPRCSGTPPPRLRRSPGPGCPSSSSSSSSGQPLLPPLSRTDPGSVQSRLTAPPLLSYTLESPGQRPCYLWNLTAVPFSSITDGLVCSGQHL